MKEGWGLTKLEGESESTKIYERPWKYMNIFIYFQKISDFLYLLFFLFHFSQLLGLELPRRESRSEINVVCLASGQTRSTVDFKSLHY